MRALACLILGLALSVAVLRPLAAEHGVQSFRNAQPSVVRILPTWPGYERPGFGAPKGTAPEGTGIYFSPDALEDRSTSRLPSYFILTAAHVVGRATRIEIMNNSGMRFDGHLVAVDRASDLAVIRAEQEGQPASFDSRLPEVGAHACVIANSFGLGLSLSCGVISAVARKNIGFNETEDFIQTDAAVNPGASGGALIAADGSVLGLVDAIFTKETDSNAGVNFSVSARLIRDVVAHWHSEGRFNKILK